MNKIIKQKTARIESWTRGRSSGLHQKICQLLLAFPHYYSLFSIFIIPLSSIFFFFFFFLIHIETQNNTIESWVEEGRPKGNKGWGPRLFPLDLQTVFPLSSSIAIRRVLFCSNDPNALILVIELQHVSRLQDVVCRFVEKRGVRERWSGWQVD